MTRSVDPGRRIATAERLCVAIADCETDLDLLLSLGKVEAETPRSFFRRDSIIPPSPGDPTAVEKPAPDDPIQLAIRVGSRIRAGREARQLTQQDLADRTGIRRPNIARLERGSSLPNLATLLKVAAGLEIALVDLIDAD